MDDRTRRVLREWKETLHTLSDSKDSIRSASRIALRHPPALGELLHHLADHVSQVRSRASAATFPSLFPFFFFFLFLFVPLSVLHRRATLTLALARPR